MLKNSEIQMLMLLEVVAPSSDGGPHNILVLPSIVREEIMQKFSNKEPWENVFEPISDETIRNKYIELFNYLDERDDTELYEESIKNKRGYAAKAGIKRD